VKGRAQSHLSHFPKTFGLFAWIALVAATGVLSACDRAPSVSEAREWTAADHDRVEEQDRMRSGVQAAPSARGASGDGGSAPGSSARAAGPDAVVELTWRNQCALCHGMTGHGDGPNGPMVHAPDVTRDEWQAKATDAEMITAIRNGKNQMPRFDLSDQVVAGLVSRIRAARGR